jgi:4-hydroxy-2-oxoheptanedioate aldolase
MTTSNAERGAWILLGELSTTRRIAGAGFAWICLDQQHGAVDDATMVRLAQDLRSEPAVLAVRVLENSASAIGRAVDVGARIVIVPLVDDADAAQRAATAIAYPPLGKRSWGPLTPLWGVEAPQARQTAQTAQLWAMIETRGAMEHLDEILAVDGISAAFVGPYDLSLALAMDFEELIAASGESAPLRRIVAACKRAGISAGAFAGNPALAARLHELGFDQLAVTTDVGIIDAGAELAVGSAAPRAGVY